MKPIVFAPDAGAEFAAAVGWYEAKAAGVREKFILHFEEVQLVAETPSG